MSFGSRLFVIDDFVLIFLVVCIGVYVNLSHITPYAARSSTPTEDEPPKETGEQLAAVLQREVRIVCFVLTTPKYHAERATAVRDTWGKRCTRLIFVTSKAEPDWEGCDFYEPPLNDTYNNLWGKTRMAFKHLYDKYRDEAEWFLKADDDTYIFMENLRYMLYQYSPDYPVHFGHAYEYYSMLYHSGGSGYVLSREALKRLNEIAFADPEKCKVDPTGVEDIEISLCLNKSEVYGGDSRDANGRQRFYPFAPADGMISDPHSASFWFWPKTWHYMRTWRHSFSNYPIAFHYIKPRQIWAYDFIAYNISVVGRRKGVEVLPPKIPEDKFRIPPKSAGKRLHPD